MLPGRNNFQVLPRRGRRPGSVHFPALAGPGFHYLLLHPACPCQAEASLGGGHGKGYGELTSGRDSAPMEMRASERAGEVASIDGLNLVTWSWLDATTRLNPCGKRPDRSPHCSIATTRNATLAQKARRAGQGLVSPLVVVTANDDRLRNSSRAHEGLSEGAASLVPS